MTVLAAIGGFLDVGTDDTILGLRDSTGRDVGTAAEACDTGISDTGITAEASSAAETILGLRGSTEREAGITAEASSAAETILGLRGSMERDAGITAEASGTEDTILGLRGSMERDTGITAEACDAGISGTEDTISD
jgi:hypothetical protein